MGQKSMEAATKVREARPRRGRSRIFTALTSQKRKGLPRRPSGPQARG